MNLTRKEMKAGKALGERAHLLFQGREDLLYKEGLLLIGENTNQLFRICGDGLLYVVPFQKALFTSFKRVAGRLMFEDEDLLPCLADAASHGLLLDAVRQLKRDPFLSVASSNEESYYCISGQGWLEERQCSESYPEALILYLEVNGSLVLGPPEKDSKADTNEEEIARQLGFDNAAERKHLMNQTYLIGSRSLRYIIGAGWDDQCLTKADLAILSTLDSGEVEMYAANVEFTKMIPDGSCVNHKGRLVKILSVGVHSPFPSSFITLEDGTHASVLSREDLLKTPIQVQKDCREVDSEDSIPY